MVDDPVKGVAEHMYRSIHGETVKFDIALLLLFIQAVAAIVRAYQECRGDKATEEETLRHLRNPKHQMYRPVLSLFWRRWVERVLARNLDAVELQRIGGTSEFASVFIGEFNQGQFDSALGAALAGAE